VELTYKLAAVINSYYLSKHPGAMLITTPLGGDSKGLFNLEICVPPSVYCEIHASA